MKNKLIKMLGVTVATVALAQTLQAVPITGNIAFTGVVQLNTASAGTATQVVNWINPVVLGDSLSFSTVALNSPVSFTAPWNISGGLSPLWSVGGFTFNLLSITAIIQGTAGGLGYLTVLGSGQVTSTNPALSAATMTWSFSVDDPNNGTPQNFTFRASNATIPDGGTTILLLGAALSGVALLKRKLTA